jgi:hypothetical protein
MAEKVGKKTGEKTKAGRDIYLTPDGEKVSEKSVTIKFGENAFVNAPSIHDGIRYTEDEIREMLLEGKIKPTSRHDTMEEAIRAAENRSDKLMNKGGMAQQMDLFNEGGLLDEGGTKDPVSGNDVPVGSLQEEVRDDVPAMLSEGEFVMPADVVRYHGLDKMMALRDEAKLGLARMEAMGQMGNAEEAILPDDVPFGLEDLDIAEEPMEMQVGGFVPQQQPFGVVQQPGFSAQNMFSIPSQFQQPAQIVAPFSQQPFAPPAPVTPVFGPGQPTGQPKETFTFSELMPTVGGTSETREYRNADGESLFIPFINGEPIYPIPEGYTPYTPDATPDPTPDPVPATTQRDFREDDPSDEPDTKPGGSAGFGGVRYDYAIGSSEEVGFGPLAALLAKKDRVILTDAQGRKANMSRETYKGLTENRNSPETKAMLDRLFEASSKADAAIKSDERYKQSLFSDNSKELDAKMAKQVISELGMEYTNQTFAEALILQEDAQNIEVSPATTPTTATVATTTSAQGGAGAAAQARLDATRSDIQKRMDDLKLTPEQQKDFLNAIIKQEKTTITFPVAGDPFATNTVDFNPATSIAQAVAQTGAAQDLLDAQTKRESETASAILASTTASSPAATVTDTEPAGLTDLLPGEPGAEIGSASYRQQRNIENKIGSAKAADPTQYAKDVRAGKYDSDFEALDKARAEVRLEQNSKTNKVGVNIKDTYGEEIARKVRDDQGTFKSVDRDGQIYRDSSHDWSEKTQVNINDNPPAKAEETAESRDDKIVCTEMYRQTQLDDWKQAIKIWGVYEKKYLTPYHQTGYHYLFKPWVRGMQTSTILTSVGAYLAKARTQHLKYIMTKGKSKDSFVGNVWCKIIHPIVYITGRMLSWQKK